MAEEDNIRYILLEDVIGGKKIVYGKKSEIVTLIAPHGEVLIVQSKNGERFPVRIEKLRQL